MRRGPATVWRSGASAALGGDMGRTARPLFSSLLGLGLLLLCSWGCPGNAQRRPPPRKIAIIGAGIGGTSAASYLRQKFGRSVKIDVFERGEVGGRLATTVVQGQEYEAGGAVIHPLNLHMKRFVKDLGLPTLELSGGVTGVYNGEKMVFEESSWFIVNILKLIWHYGLQSLRMHMWVEDVLDKFMRIYRYQSHEYAFSSVEKLLHSLGGDDFLQMLNQTLNETLQKAGFNQKFISEIVAPIMRVNYGQSTSINGFVGAVSMASTDSGLWSVEGGNKLVCSGLLENSESNLIRGSVMFIEDKTKKRNPGDPRRTYEVVYQVGSETYSDTYEVILVATPLIPEIANITFLNFDPPIEEFQQQYQPIVTTFVKGRLNTYLFCAKCRDGFGYSTILTTDKSKLLVNSIGLVTSVYEPSYIQPSKDGSGIWKMFAQETLTKHQIARLFNSYIYASKQPWLAYPRYQPPQKCPSIILHDHVYYLNSIECAASAMEMSAISAHNIALLVYNRWNGYEDMIDQELLYERLKVEL
ncbi:prenylcysteine oxidase 1 [Sorex fumeus]|uniref:prenylcysteine oxidase 1 n=1 Tax=Sorex fumeus TaxID=62283 RepID=UPI0024AD3B02|nr:prenylcysteine oxidase 1 [Sorex fumeus]